jgi:SAM-dependent methyltransferase
VFNPNKLVATDISDKSLQVLRKKYNSTKIKTENAYFSDVLVSCDLCFCNGVFHHIMLKDREQTAKFVYDSLQSGGYFYFWENNPWNPATHWVMSRVSFDRTAVKIFPHQAVKLLQKVGFEIKLVHYMFIFPRFLKILRPIERFALRLPFGCQYLVQAYKN